MQKKLLLFFFAISIFLSGSSQSQNYFQQQVNYIIDVSLNDADNTLQGFEKIEYINNSPDTLHYILFHLWPNAYKNDRTAFSEQLLKNNSIAFYFSKEKDRGYINQLDFKVNDTAAELRTDSMNIDITTLILPQPLPPHQSIIITTPFHEKLPYNFSRGGHVGQTYQVTQWFPKPAVYDAKGWHQMPYLDQGEFYSEYGNWNVNITVPDNYIVAASGELRDTVELQQLKNLAKEKPTAQKNYKLFVQLTGAIKKRQKPQYETLMPPSSTRTKTFSYVLNNAHDFAWFASKLFLVQHDTVQLSNHIVDVFAYYNPWQADEWKSSTSYMKDAVKFYSKKIAEYPYNIVSAVAGNDAVGSDGMEYPTITLITTNGEQQELDATLAHEIGHNWLYGILGSNERDHAWMDEGINEFFQQEYEIEKYGNTSDAYNFKSKFLQQRIPSNFDEVQVETLQKIKKSQPIDTTSIAYTETNYGLIVYEYTPVWLNQLRQKLGAPVFDSSIRFYYDQWKFKHPYPENFKQSIEQSSSRNIDSLYEKIYSTAPLERYNKPKRLRLATFFNLKETNKYNYISLLPAIGLNEYDKLMIGGIIHNYQLPLNRFNFFVVPLYATGSKQFNGAARFSYNFFAERHWLELSASGITYSYNHYDDGINEPLNLRLIRIVPSAKLVLYNKDLRSAQRIIVQARSFLLREDELNFKTVINPPDTLEVPTKQPVHSYINQLNFTLLDNRILYPYNVNLTIDQGKQFIRAGLSAKYFFNYGKDKGGLLVRFFAGKFFYLQPKTVFSEFETDQYHLTLTGPRGFEDYTFSNYFVGRNEYEGGSSQQIMERDGFFKVRTDLLSKKIGKTDDWLMALNFTSDIPDKVNPLSILPVKIPLKLFADIGTYSDAWKDNSNARFLYDAGIQLSLVNSLVNIYAPIIYSKVYSDYFKSALGDNRFWKIISFNINLEVFKLNNLSNKIPL